MPFWAWMPCCRWTFWAHPWNSMPPLCTPCLLARPLQSRLLLRPSWRAWCWPLRRPAWSWPSRACCRRVCCSLGDTTRSLSVRPALAIVYFALNPLARRRAPTRRLAGVERPGRTKFQLSTFVLNASPVYCTCTRVALLRRESIRTFRGPKHTSKAYRPLGVSRVTPILPRRAHGVRCGLKIARTLCFE